jgi:hypothetical protein
MVDAVSSSLVLAVGVAISPIPVIGVVLMLTTPNARANGSAFLLGWLAGLGVVGGVTLAVSAGADAAGDSSSADWVYVVKLGLGSAAVATGIRQWRKSTGPDADGETPGWMESADRFTVPRAAGLGAASAVNPKNLILVVGGVASIAEAGGAAGTQIAALAVFIGVASIGTVAPVALYAILGQRSEAMLGNLRAWLTAHGGVIMAVILLLIGAKLLGDAVSGLAG